MKMNRMRLREFEALRALVVSGTTVGASRRLGISQSAVSRALAQLEERVGRALFIRSSGRIEPTREALSLNARLDPLFETLSEIEGADWAQPEDEPLRLIVPPTLAHHFVIPRLAGYARRNPGRRVQLEIQATDTLIAGIVDLRYDVGLTSATIQRAGVNMIPWRRTRVVCAMPEGHPLEAKSVIRPEDLNGIETVEFLRRLGTRASTDQIFGRAGVERHTVAETATNMAAIELVREGMGVTIVNPFPILSQPFPGVSVRPFEAPIVYQTSFVLPAGSQPTEAARHFMRFVKLTSPADPWSEAL